MSKINPALGHHIAEVAIAEFAGNVPADAENDLRAIAFRRFL